MQQLDWTTNGKKENIFPKYSCVRLALYYYSDPERCLPSVKLLDESLSLFNAEFIQKQRRYNLEQEKFGDARLCWRCPQYSVSNFVAVICTQMLHLRVLQHNPSRFSSCLPLSLRRKLKKSDFDGLTIRTTEGCASLGSDDRCPQNGCWNSAVTCQAWFIMYNFECCCIHTKTALQCVLAEKQSYSFVFSTCSLCHSVPVQYHQGVDV